MFTLCSDVFFRQKNLVSYDQAHRYCVHIVLHDTYSKSNPTPHPPQFLWKYCKLYIVNGKDQRNVSVYENGIICNIMHYIMPVLWEM